MFCGWYWLGDIIPMNRRWRISISTIVLWLILIERYHTHEQALTNIYKHVCFVADIDWEISYPWTQALPNIYKHVCFVADIDSEISYPWTPTLANIYKHVCFINVYTTHYILQRIIVEFNHTFSTILCTLIRTCVVSRITTSQKGLCRRG